jgi:hypothetical protein
VIQGWLNGKTRNQLAEELCMATGSVSKILKEWNQKVGQPEAKELREFSVWVNKSGMTISQCAKAFRIHQILKNLMVEDGTICNFEEDLDNFYSFVIGTFKGCKDLGLSPKNCIECIGDLIEFSNSNLSLPSSSNDMDTINNQSSEITSSAYIADKKPVYISKISEYINQKRRQNEQINQQTMVCQDESINYKCEVIMAKNRLDRILKDNNITITQIHWLDSLRKEFSLQRGIDVIKKVKEFAKVIRDLESFGYDPNLLLNQISDKNSLENEQKYLLDEINHYLIRRDNLRDENADLRTQNSKNRQILDVVGELKLMGFGLHELKQLKFTVVEIAEANNILADLAVSRFLKDVEKHYDDKLGLENKVNESKAKINNLDDEIANKQFILLLLPFIGPALSRLLQYGMSVEDIMGIHNLVQSCKENTFSFDCDHVIDGKSSTGKDDNNTNTIRPYCMTPLTDELKKYGGIKLAIKAQLEKLDNLSKEIDMLERQKQDLLAYFNDARYAVNTANSMVFYSKKILDNFVEYVKGKFNVTYFLYLPLRVHLIRHFPVFKRKDKKGIKHKKKGKGR